MAKLAVRKSRRGGELASMNGLARSSCALGRLFLA
jgi:hypothetical protein